jgi:protoporphyrinogen/coproporphyrinogen III oxidase
VRVVVIGGGISGLSAAWTLSQSAPDAEIVVLEASPQVGGKLRVGRVGGVEVDLGAEAMLARRPEGIALIDELGLSADVITPTTTSAGLRAGGGRHALPARTMLGVPADPEAVRASGVLSAAGLARMAAEPELGPLAPLVDDVAVGALVRARMGDEVVGRLVDPLLGGVYAGRADELSLLATMPALGARLRTGAPSLLEAAAAITPAPSPGPSATPVFVSLRGGLGRLPAALAASDRFEVRTGVTVTAIDRTPTGFALTTGSRADPQRIEADAVIVATPAAKAARLLAAVASAAVADLGAIESASMAIVTFAFRNVSPPPGSGLLIGSDEGFAVKAVTVSSQKWPLDDGGLTLLRASIGRVDQSQELQRGDDELIALALRELQPLLGISGRPVDAIVTRWGGGLPQYGVGHLDRVARIRAALAAVPGLAICGAALDGVGIPACIAAARRAAAEVLVPRPA